MMYNSNGKATAPIKQKAKSKIKELVPNQIEIDQMMEEYVERSKDTDLVPHPVLNDPFNTVFYMSSDKNPGERLRQYHESRSYTKIKQIKVDGTEI